MHVYVSMCRNKGNASFIRNENNSNCNSNNNNESVDVCVSREENTQ